LKVLLDFGQQFIGIEWIAHLVPFQDALKYPFVGFDSKEWEA
jgi:hypothetical protein